MAATRSRIVLSACACARRGATRSPSGGRHAEALDIRTGYRHVGEERWSTQSNPFSFGRERAQPGAPMTGLPSSEPDEEQVAGIDRHAEMLHGSARSSRATGITSRRSAIAEAPNTTMSSASPRALLGKRRCQARASCATCRCSLTLAPAGRRLLIQHVDGFCDPLALQTLQEREEISDWRRAYGGGERMPVPGQLGRVVPA
jgi:hypothetical protein